MPTKITIIFETYLISNYKATVAFESMLSENEIPESLKGLDMLLANILSLHPLSLKKVILEPVEGDEAEG